MMDIYEKKLEILDGILIKYDLGYIYDFLNDRKNGLIFPFFCNIMDQLNKINIDFSITTNRNANAGVIYNEKLIFVSCGLIDRLSKLAELIYCSGVLNGEQKECRFHDLNLVDNEFSGFNHVDFSFGDDTLYLFIFDCLLTFVIFHELGHLYHNHGDRLNNISDDIIGHRNSDYKNLISSHAKELVADNYAFFNLVGYIEASIEKHSISNLMVFSKNHGIAIISLIFIASYFHMMDGGNVDHFHSTHPIASMRACSIMANYIGTLEDSVKSHIDVQMIISSLSIIFSRSSNKFKNNWGSLMSSPEMTKWNKDIYLEYPKWIRRSES